MLYSNVAFFSNCLKWTDPYQTLAQSFNFSSSRVFTTIFLLSTNQPLSTILCSPYELFNTIDLSG